MGDDSSSEAICVGVRLRPFVAYEHGQKQVLTISNKVVSVVAEVAGKEAKDFGFDQAMDSTDPQSPNFVSQEKCYDLMASRMVGHIFQGYNTCLFCYGQTGTGKTTTIMGTSSPESEQGLLMRLLSDCFKESARIVSQGTAEVQMKVQMLEVYNEHIKDLLLPHGAKDVPKADVHVHPALGVYIKGVTEEAVETCEKCIRLIEYGNTMKTVAATAMNAKSSRSHTVFKLNVEKKGGVDNMTIMSEVFFVDLAGRENEKTTKVVGERLVELTFINRSLMWLSTCIQSLGQDHKRKSMAPRKSMAAGMEARKSVAPGMEGAPRKSVAPGSMAKDMSKFRNSKLTLLLSNALSGNSKTAMIGTLSPAVANFEESYSTLNFANTVKNIKVEAKIASAVDKESLVQSLQDEVKQLKEQLSRARHEEGEPGEEIAQKLEGAESLCVQYQKKWEDSKQESAELMAKREQAMEKLGIARWKLAASKAVSKFTWKDEPQNLLPYLTNFSDDPHLSGRFVLHPTETQTEYSIGFGDEADLKIPPALGVSSRTGYLRREFGRLFIRAVEKRMSVSVNGSKAQGVGRVEVNGSRIGTEWVELQHQDCVVLGRSLMYYAFTEPDGGIKALPMEKRFGTGSPSNNESSETLINNILGPARAANRDQLQLAREYYSHMQRYNLDADGTNLLHNFLLQAAKAKKMVEEANDITAEVKPDSGLRFELTAIAPVLAFGFGHACFPDFCVRCVREVPFNRSSRRLTIERMRRQSTLSNVEMLRKFVMDGEGTVAASEEVSLEVLYTWHFPKFTTRLQYMQDVRESWAEDPENYVIDPNCDPWSEYGLGEIAQLRADSQEDLSKSRDEIRRLRESSRDTTLCHEILSSSASRRGTDNQDTNANSTLMLELRSLRESLRLKDVENARLRQDIERIKAEAIKRLSTMAQSNQAMMAQSNHAVGSIPDGMSTYANDMKDVHVEARKARPNNSGNNSGEDWVAASAHAKHCLEVSKANLSLVEDLFRLSISLLRAGTTCLQANSEDGAMDVSRHEQARLAAAASDLVSFFSNGRAFSHAGGDHQLSDFYNDLQGAWPQQVNRQVSGPTSLPSCSGQQHMPSYLPGPVRNGFSTPRYDNVPQVPPMVAAPLGNSSMQSSPIRSRPVAAANGLDANISVMPWQAPAMLAQASPMRSRPMVMSPNQAPFLAQG